MGACDAGFFDDLHQHRDGVFQHGVPHARVAFLGDPSAMDDDLRRDRTG